MNVRTKIAVMKIQFVIIPLDLILVLVTVDIPAMASTAMILMNAITTVTTAV